MKLKIKWHMLEENMGLPDGSNGKESAGNAGRPEFDAWVRKIPGRWEWMPTPVFLKFFI